MVGTGLGSCPVVVFGVSSVELLCSTTREVDNLVNFNG